MNHFSYGDPPSCFSGRGDEIECEQKCADILSSDPFNADAGDTLVQLMLYRELYESAIIHFKQNLERDPHHYSSLAQVLWTPNMEILLSAILDIRREMK